MVTYLCDICDGPFGSELLAREHEKITVTHNNFRQGFVFRMGYPQDLTSFDYGIVTSPAKASMEHVQQYNVMFIHDGWLKEGYNPHWVKRCVVRGDSPLIEKITDKEFSKIHERLNHWVGREREYMDFGKKLPQELELTNKLG